VRTNPPNAILQTFTTSPGYLNVSDPSMGYVFTPGPQTARHQLFLPDPNLEMPYTDQWSISYERQIPWDSAIRVSYNGNHVNGTLKYNLENLPKSPLDGPVTVVNHPNNAPAAGWPEAPPSWSCWSRISAAPRPRSAGRRSTARTGHTGWTGPSDWALRLRRSPHHNGPAADPPAGEPPGRPPVPG